MTGQALIYSNDPADVLVRHDARPIGKSNYGLTRILALVFSILFSYSLFPLRAAAVAGFVVAVGSFVLGAFYLVRSFFVDTPVAGWTTIAVMLSIFNGVVIALLSMLGEYVIRTLNTVSTHQDLPRHRPGLLVIRHLLVIGAQRCGTTYLHTMLDSHEQVTMARPAQPGAQGLLQRRGHSPRARSGTARPTSRTPATSCCSARRAPATSRTRTRRRGRRRCWARSTSWPSCATR